MAGEPSRRPSAIAVWAPPLALLLYGGFSVPAPPALGWAEAAIGALLALAVGWRWPLAVITGHALRAESPEQGEAVDRPVAVAALAWLLWVPLLRGAAVGADGVEILRDVVPLLYLFLPLLLVPALRRAGPSGVRGLAAGLALAGLLLAVRWWDQVRWGFGAVGARAMADGDAYLLNAPSVLFAAVALPALAITLVAGGGTGRWVWLGRWIGVPLCTVGGALCLGALAGAVHRTALGLAALSLAMTALWWVRRRPWLAVPVALGLGLATLVAGDALVGAWQQAAEKTRLTGVNARWDEAVAVIDHVTASPWTLLLGDGWGARIANPAVGGWRVGYTHTLASYSLLKTGLLGTLALVAYLGTLLVRPWRRLLALDPPLAFAVVPPLLMALGLHTSFKYLDTGVVLSLLLLASECRKGLSRS
ncbi:hypothetical protein TSO352_05885 [Azospirillum sp. TSO35-2]|nr:hypothetical protein TSO352_05885 [Azospirillum sp. TSO35-2]